MGGKILALLLAAALFLAGCAGIPEAGGEQLTVVALSLIHISEPTRH